MEKIINNLPKLLPLQDQIGRLSNLSTSIKTDLVNAINWFYDYVNNKLGANDISSIGDGTITSAISSLHSNVETINNNLSDINNRLGVLVKKDLLEIVASQYVNKPWIALKYAVEQGLLEVGKLYVGRISNGAQFGYWGQVISANYSSFIVQSYNSGSLCHVYCLGGTWYYEKISISGNTSF